jgi:competence protein ComEC
LRFEWDGVGFELFAVAGRYCVLRVSVEDRALLLGGDLDAAAERQLVARLPPRALASDVVILGRQASASGSSPEWIEATDTGRFHTSGRIAIASGGIAGTESRGRALARWRSAGVRVFDTASDGAVEIGFGTQGIFSFATVRSARYPFAWRRVE